MEKAEKNGVKIHLPVDAVTGNKFAEDAEVRCRRANKTIFTWNLEPSQCLLWDI